MEMVFHTNYHYKTVWDTPLHQHDCPEITYIYQGRLRVKLPDQSFEIHEKQLVFFPPNTPHVSEMLDGPIEMIFMLTSQYPSAIPPRMAVDDLPDDIIGRLVKQIYLEYNCRPSRDIELMFAWQRLIDAYFRQFYSVDNSEIVNAMCRILHNNISNCDFSINDGFAGLGYSANYLRSVFKNEMRVTPKEYLMEQRITMAQQLLGFAQKEGMQIKDISARSGFKDPLYFSRYFRQLMGMTPSQYMQCRGEGSMPDQTYAKMSLQPSPSDIQYMYPVYSERFSK